jgi:flagellar hook protein FlgE
MSISSSLNAGVAGLAANATRMATIADNIANSSTFGYKRSTVDFHAMVIDIPGGASFATGGVRVSTGRAIEERGAIIGSSNATDLAVDGRGFIPVTSLAGMNSGERPLSLVTTGSFRPDADGILRTDNGHVLMGWPTDRDGNVGSVPRDTTSALVPVRIDRTMLVANPTTRVGLAVNLPATATIAGASGTAQPATVEYYGNLGTAERLTVTFTPTVPVTGASNEWTMTVRDSASADAIVGEYRLAFDASQTEGGTLAAVTTLSGGAYDTATGTIPLTVGGGTLTLVIGQIGARDGMTQYAAPFSTARVDRDGSPPAGIAALEVDAAGFLNAIYDQGFARRLFQIPVVDVANPNGLKAADHQSYRVTPESGAFFMWDAGTGPAGSVVGFSREESTTDVAAELTRLIQTQRAYSSNAKVIQTVDEMLQETTNIKR